MSKKISKLCIICNENFWFYPSMRPNVLVCSRKCLGIYQSTQKVGILLKGGTYGCVQTFRQMARKLFLDQCAICGWNETSCDVCHIIAKKNGGQDTFENVTMLCPNHHRMFDNGLIKIEEIIESRLNILSSYKIKS